MKPKQLWQREKRGLFIILLSLAITAIILAIFPSKAAAAIAEPVFTTGENIATQVQPLGTTTISGNLVYRWQVLTNIEGCIVTNSPPKRYQYAQWYGTSWIYSGGGGFGPCETGGFFALAGQTIGVTISNTNEGYFCLFWGTGGVTLNEPLHKKRVCVYQSASLTYEPYTEIPLVYPPLPVIDPKTGVANFETRFTNIDATGASTSIALDIDYYLNTDEYGTTNRPDMIQASFIKQGGLFTSDEQVHLQRKLILPLVTGNNATLMPVAHDFDDGTYTTYVNFWNITTNGVTFPATNIVFEFEIDGGVIVSETIISIENGLTAADEITYQECSLTNLSGCFVNALIYLFVPSDGSLDQFLSLWEQVRTKPPFGYITGVIDQLEAVDTNATAAFTFGDVPFQNEIFSPLKTLFATGLWFVYAIYFLIRVQKIRL
jgi:hypothetical protein